MGLNAAVMCRCLQDGLPVPERYGMVVVDPDGYPVPAPAYRGNEALHDDFDRWVSTCCPHPGMEAVSRQIGNWSGVRRFRQVLLDNDEGGRFGTLLKELPNANGGLTSGAAASRMHAELRRFQGADDLGLECALVDPERDEVLWRCSPRDRSDWIFSGTEGIRLGIDGDGFYVRSSDGTVLFRSRAFSQHVVARSVPDEASRVRFRDAGSGAEFVCGSTIHSRQIPWDDGSMRNADGRFRYIVPEELRFEHRPVAAADYGFHVESLLAVCEGAIATGNPIRWS